MTMEISCTRAQADHQQLLNCKNTLERMDDNFKDMTKLLSIAGSEVRLKILFLLNMEDELCPCDIADILEMSVPAISQHIRKIKDAGFISSRREGQTLYYSLVKDKTALLNAVFTTIKMVKKTA
ncbi:ArsR/SmtB family transcription factor [Christiangramia forsetii]|uniref:ArsR family transcriptional regulator protein n=2 Tax=Christiangramia forsetii TaxID=411153 RepID=A0M104_CHRFK|nr:metalloregulator ArsR/SmtB family transcription factor [Christiangramia forsetii]CAL66299.1 ArsR family transcriptional regulator protein [Christiangramia forsetii KT0803]